MTPEYLEQLAERADPEKLYLTPWSQLGDLSPEQRMQLDTGVALRRLAQHQSRLLLLLGTGKSLLITPLSENGTATKEVPMPESHQRLLPRGRR